MTQTNAEPRQSRRVVTGLGDDGRSRVVIDAPISSLDETAATLMWRCSLPADNAGSQDRAAAYTLDLLHSGDANFAMCEFAPGVDAFMHATDTIDFLVVISGRVTLVLEDGVADLGPGDCVVDRGVPHAWRNDHEEPCRCAVVTIPARPVGRGRTI